MPLSQGPDGLLEFHLTDAALGLVLDVDPDHKFDSLLIALRGLGIELEAPTGKSIGLRGFVRHAAIFTKCRILGPTICTTAPIALMASPRAR
ncbi:hypothetical protein [Candidatus Binatus sp.]|uniref:hypothetical protein n=1 Tax=Candidatus Binatus sp. TaxID=2811406 RepID=UPI003C31DA6C